MSDVMLLGILRMPIPKNPDEITLRQFVNRAREAADRIESDSEKIENLERRIEEIGESDSMHANIARYNFKNMVVKDEEISRLEIEREDLKQLVREVREQFRLYIQDARLHQPGCECGQCWRTRFMQRTDYIDKG